MHAEGHGLSERAAAGLCMEVLTLSRDMALFGNSRKEHRWGDQDVYLWPVRHHLEDVSHPRLRDVHFLLRQAGLVDGTLYLHSRALLPATQRKSLAGSS